MSVASMPGSLSLLLRHAGLTTISTQPPAEWQTANRRRPSQQFRARDGLAIGGGDELTKRNAAMKFAIAAVILSVLALAQVKALPQLTDACATTKSCFVGP